MSFDPIRSLRAQLAWVFALLGLVLASGIGIVVYAVTADQLSSSARAGAANAVTLAADAYDHAGEVVIGAVKDDRAAPAALRRAVAGGRLGTDVEGRTVWAGTPLPGGHGIYVREQSDIPHTLATLQTTLIIVGLAAVALAGGLGVLVSSGLSRKLRDAADVADRVAEGDLSARIGAAGKDEVARLGRAIDAMSVAVSERIERERRFSADVAHELRTPLTGLVNAASLLDESRPAEIVRERVAALRGLVEDLLEVLRLEQGDDRSQAERVELLELVRRVVTERASTAGIGAGELSGGPLPGNPLSDTAEVRVGGNPLVVSTDPRRLERIVGNLLDNALRHGTAPVTVTVSAADRPGTADTGRGEAVIELRDSGPGFPVQLLAEGPQPFRTGASERGTGTGLGLVIAASQAAVIGAELTLENALDGGAIARLQLRSDLAETQRARV